MRRVIRARAPRPRQARSIANDARILDDIEHCLDDAGWEETSLVQVAKQAGLDHTTVADRFPNRPAAVAGCWRERLSQILVPALRECVAAVDQVETSLTGGELLAALEPFAFPEPRMRAAAEVLLVSRYEDTLAEAVRTTLGPELDEWLTPRRGDLTRAHAARRAFALSLAFGFLLEARRRLPSITLDLAPGLDVMSAALKARTFPVTLPAERAEHLFEPPRFGSDDPALERLLGATLAEVGEHGYEAATLKSIAAAAGYTTGLIFRRYDTKLALFTDASDRMLANAGAANQDFQVRVAAESSPAVADACLSREFMRPDHRNLRTITTEQYRISWHDHAMQESVHAAQDAVAQHIADTVPGGTLEQARGRAFIMFSRGVGMLVLADLQAGAWELPYDVVTLPLYGEI